MGEHTSAPIRQHPPHFGFPSSHLTYRSCSASLAQLGQCRRIPLTRLRLQIYSNPGSSQSLVTRNASVCEHTRHPVLTLERLRVSLSMVMGNRKADRNEEEMYGKSRSRYQSSLGFRSGARQRRSVFLPTKSRKVRNLFRVLVEASCRLSSNHVASQRSLG